MSKKELDFSTASNQTLKILEDVKEMVLSTCSQNRVTSRVISCACQGTKVYFLSWGHHQKCIQIRENPNVALCFKYLQIEGIANIRGNALADENRVYTKIYEEKQPDLYKGFSRFKGMIIIEIDIKSITAFKMEGMKCYLDQMDFDKKIVYREDCEEN